MENKKTKLTKKLTYRNDIACKIDKPNFTEASGLHIYETLESNDIIIADKKDDTILLVISQDGLIYDMNEA